MKCSRTDSAGETTLRIEGALDALTAPDLRSVVDALVAEGRRAITLDLTALTLIDSSGVGLVVSLFKRIRGGGGQVRIAGLRDQPRAIFRLLRLDRVFPEA